MKKIISLFMLIVLQSAAGSLLAYDEYQSGRSDIWENPFVAYGYNPQTKVLTGYLVALRTAPGRTDECKLSFSGNVAKSNKLSVEYIGEAKDFKGKGASADSVSIFSNGAEKYLKFSKKMLGGDCDWILPFLVGDQVSETSDAITVSMKTSNVGKWIAVYAISAKRARFHSRPDSSSVQKKFVIEGDVVFVYEEKPDWYFVQYEEGKRKTAGWIRKSDTFQP